jgi:hypothetical protein
MHMSTSKALTINANLFRIAARISSVEETRYYLNGVYVEPHEKGVLLVAIDGHRLICIRDKDGEADAPAIIATSRELSKHCKPARRGEKRLLHIQDDQLSVLMSPKNSKVYEGIYTRGHALIDGTFPDWRRCLPGPIGKAKLEAALFNSLYVAEFGHIGSELDLELDPPVTRHEWHPPAMQIVSPDMGGPSLIRWPIIPQAFGVLMPMRFDGLGPMEVPDWAGPVPERRAKRVRKAA